MTSKSITGKSTTGRYAQEEGDRLLGKLSEQIARAIQSPGADEMHDLRVAIRRFTRVLAVLKACFPRDESRRLRRELRRIMEQAGQVRDRDIALRLVAKVSPAGSETAPPFPQEEREDAAQILTRSLRRWVKLNLPSAWRAAGKSGVIQKKDKAFCSRGVEVTAARVLPPVGDRFFRRGKDAVRDGAPAHVIHRFRIAAKNLRYTLELFAPLYGDSIAGLMDHLKEIQDLLGDINDASIVRHMLAETADREILSALKKRERKKTDEFRQQYAPLLSNARARRQWKHTVRNIGSGVQRKTATGRRRPV